MWRCNTENYEWFAWRDGLCEGMVCVQIICNTENDKWFVWRNGLCEGMVCVKGWIVSGLYNVTQFRQYVIQRRINVLYYILSGAFEGMVSVKRWFVWRDGLCHFTETRIHPFTQTIYHYLYYILSCSCEVTQSRQYIIQRRIISFVTLQIFEISIFSYCQHHHDNPKREEAYNDNR